MDVLWQYASRHGSFTKSLCQDFVIINRAGGCKIAAKKPNFDQSRGQLTTQPVSVHRKPAVSEPSCSRGPTLFGGSALMTSRKRESFDMMGVCLS